MAEYYAVLSRAVASLDTNTGETRRAVYDKARNALIGQLKAIDPPLPTAEISRQRLELEEAIRRVERETADTPSDAARVPIPRTSRPAAAPASTVRPQDVFRRAIEEAEGRPAEPPRVERANGRSNFSWDDEADLHAEPVPAAASASSAREAYSSDGRDEPRLVPNYDYEWDPNAQPTTPATNGRSSFPAADMDRQAGQPRRRGRARTDDHAYTARDVRPSRLPIIILLVLIVAMVGGLAALAWSQRALIADLMHSTGSSDGATAKAPVTPAPVADASGKDADRLPAQASDAGARDVTASASPSQADSGSGDALVAQRAVLYEEPLAGGGDGSKGVLAFNATAIWQFVNKSGEEPEVHATITVPDRDLTISLHLRRNVDQTLPASHVIEVAIKTGNKFGGGAVREVPRLVMKPAEDARGQPLVGASAKVADGFFWIALSGVQADIEANMGLLRDRSWFDLPLVYENGQRAILTFEKGTPGERAFEKALALWTG